jgi:glutamine amidotransferase
VRGDRILVAVCRLFGMSGGPARVRASFWLLEAADSLVVQSHRQPDGAGVATFDPDGRPRVVKRPLAAYEDERFVREAYECDSRTFAVHLRAATSGARTLENTHPFEQRGRVLGHNGVVGGIERLERELGEAMALVHGDTDSERWFALVTREIEARQGDVTGGIAAAARWVARELPLYSLNLVLATPDGLWALRYPDTNELWVLERPPGHPHGDHFDFTSSLGTHIVSRDEAPAPVVVVASEPLDEEHPWRPLEPGELLHVGADLGVRSSLAVADPPAYQLSLDDLGERAAAAQAGG